jgi:hypothetical protein
MAFEGAVTEKGLTALAVRVAPLLGWDSAREATEVSSTVRLLQDRHRMSIR